MRNNPSLIEFNTRVWIKRYSTKSEDIKLNGIPDSFFDDLHATGFNYVWLMGVWQNNEEIAYKYCFEEGLLKEYSHALPDWKREDVIGSPYSIDEYEVNSRLGSTDDLLIFKEKLNRTGIKLILDFVPNHFSADSKLISINPEIFLEADEELFSADSHTFYKSLNNRYFAHGKDPYFPAWQDTIQVNYFSESAQQFMIDVLIKLTALCDGVRCDMAMLPLLKVFGNTWKNAIDKMNYKKPKKEFWETAIKEIKSIRRDFLFIAEAYWDLEWELQKLGFDYTYDKRLTDRLKKGNVADIRNHLLADEEFQSKSVRFLENHDEERTITSFGEERSKAAAVLTSTIQGMRFYHDGQFEGWTVKLPVQLGREPAENVNREIQKFYEKLLPITSEPIFQEGRWQLLEVLPAGDAENSFQNILAWKWNLEDENRLVVINYSGKVSRCRIKFYINSSAGKIDLKDLLNGNEYIRSTEDIATEGLYIELRKFQSHIFLIIPR